MKMMVTLTMYRHHLRHHDLQMVSMLANRH